MKTSQTEKTARLATGTPAAGSPRLKDKRVDAGIWQRWPAALPCGHECVCSSSRQRDRRSPALDDSRAAA
jgi:hypothetical protein